MITDFTSALPVNSIWNRNVKATISDIDDNKLYIANSGFNIATDAILLILPLIIIWRMQMTWLHKLGLSGIFCLGALTLIASIMRLYYYYKVNVYDGACEFKLSNVPVNVLDQFIWGPSAVLSSLLLDYCSFADILSQ